MIKEAIVLAGGLGTRLRETLPGLPKCMAPVNERPFLEYLFDYLELYSVKKVILATGHLHESIENHFRNKFKYIQIEYSREEAPLGTGGAVKKAFRAVEGKQALIFNGDTHFRVNLGKLYDFQLIHQSKISLAVREMKDTSRYGTVEFDERARITAFREKGFHSGKGFINGGVYALHKDFFLSLDLPDAFSLEKDLFEKFFQEHPMYALKCNQFFIDIGIPEDYEKAQQEFKLFEF